MFGFLNNWYISLLNIKNIFVYDNPWGEEVNGTKQKISSKVDTRFVTLWELQTWSGGGIYCMAGVLLQYLDSGFGQAYADIAEPQNFGIDFSYDIQTWVHTCPANAGPPEFVDGSKGWMYLIHWLCACEHVCVHLYICSCPWVCRWRHVRNWWCLSWSQGDSPMKICCRNS